MKSVDKVRVLSVSSISEVCSCFDLKRDAYYKYQKRYQKKKEVQEQILDLVKERRKELPREGCRKLYNALQEKFNKYNLKVGRDSLFDILRENNMLVKRKKSFVKTTNSYHRFHKYGNLIYEFIPTKPGMGIRHNLHQNRKWVLLPGFDYRYVFKKNCRL